MLQIDWGNPKISIIEFERFLTTYLGSQYDGILQRANYLQVVTYSPLSPDQENFILDFVSNLNYKPKEFTFPSSKQDAFGNSIFVEPVIIFSTHFSNSDHADFLWNKQELLNGTVIHDMNSASMLLSTTTENGSKAEYQTFRCMQYVGGQGLEYVMSSVFHEPKVNIRQRLGMKNNASTEGIYFECDENGMHVVCEGVILEKIPRVDWDDPLDGTGPSRINLDFTKGNIFIIHYQWLGYGDIEYAVEVGSEVIKCHTIKHHGILNRPYTQSPSFHGFVSIENIGETDSPSTFRMGCFSVRAFGGALMGSNTIYASNETTLKPITSSTYTPLIAIRLNTDLKNHEATLERLKIFSTSAIDIHYELIFNSTIIGGTWINMGDGLQKNVSMTSYSGGIEFDGGYVNKQGEMNTNATSTFTRMGRYIDGTSNTILLVAKSLGGTADVGAVFTLKEIK